MLKLMKLILFFLTVIISTVTFSQTEWKELSGKQRAFFYNVSRNIKNIKPELLHLFEFTDSIPYINDTLPDYAYVEKRIVEDSTKLVLHYTEFARKNNGLIADLATHYALWELGLLLQFRKSEKSKFQYLKPILKVFEQYIIESAPQAALKTLSNGNYELATSISRYYAPNLTINEKIASIKNSGFSENDQLIIIRSIYRAQEKYILNRSLEIFKLLGGDVKKYINFLIAAGDGENYSDLETIYISKYSRALQDLKALFYFETELKKDKITKKQILNVLSNPTKKLITHPVFLTQIHIDVWGFHPERQTTIVIQKGGNSYILYGNNKIAENRFVSPDSTYGEGSTYWRLIYELENIHIADLKEKIYGKKGYDYWIAEYEERIEVTRMKIKITENDLNSIRYEPSAPKKIKKKKIKKKDLGKSDQAGKGHPTGKPTGTAKKKQKLQNRLIALNTQLENEIRTLNELKIEKEEAFDILASYQTLLDKMRKNVGHTFVDYKKDKYGNFIFNDGTTFNYLNQDFIFYPNGKTENFEIITIAFGEKVFSKKIEEVFIHLNLTYPNPKQKFTLLKELDNTNETSKITISDSIQIMELFYALGNTDKKINIKAIGGGILGGTSPYYHRDSLSSPVLYDKNKVHSKISTKYIYRVDINNEIYASITAFRDNMIPFNFNEKYGKYYLKAKLKIPQLNEIDFYTVVLAKKRMDIWLEQLNSLAINWLQNTNYQSKVVSKLKSAKNKHFYSILSNSVKIKSSAVKSKK